MPCSMPDMDEREDKEYRAKCNATTKAACEMALLLKSHTAHLIPRLSADTQSWIKQHEADDDRRRARESATYEARMENLKSRKEIIEREMQALDDNIEPDVKSIKAQFDDYGGVTGFPGIPR
jgi:hypothetical protein